VHGIYKVIVYETIKKGRQSYWS